MEKLKLLFKTSRPISWVNTAYPFAAGYLFTGGEIGVYFWITVVFFLIPYNLLMYGVNDVFDYESDMRNPRKGGVEGAITPKAYHRLILTSSAMLSLPFIAFILADASNWQQVLVFFALIFFVLAYSYKGLRFKEVAFLDSATSSIHFVGPLIFALALTQSFNNASLIVIVSFFLWGCASHAFGAVQDIIPDRKARIKSIATTIGAKNTVILCLILYITSMGLLMSTQSIRGYVVGLACLLYIVNIIPFKRINDKSSGEARAGWRRFIKINYIVGMVITLSLLI